MPYEIVKLGAKVSAASPGGSVYVRLLVAPSAPRLWGLSQEERLRRALVRHGVAEANDIAETWPDDGTVLMLRGDVVYDGAVLGGLLDHREAVLVLPGDDGARAVAAHAPAGGAESACAALAEDRLPDGLRTMTPEQVAASYHSALRKRAAPLCLPVGTDNVREVERRIYLAAYKGVTDLVTKYVWPAPALWVTRLCVSLGLSPNAVTLVSAILVVAATVLFALGYFGAGLLAAWPMTFLDTVDGKLARVTLTSTPFGNVFDHGIDLIHPPFWYAAWGYGLIAGVGLPDGWLAPILWIVVGGYVFGRLIEGYFIYRFRVEIHVWRRFDSFFRLVTARRNPNLILLTAAAAVGRPFEGLVAVAAWTVVSNLLHLVRIAQAEAARSRGETISSWLQAAP